MNKYCVFCTNGISKLDQQFLQLYLFFKVCYSWEVMMISRLYFEFEFFLKSKSFRELGIRTKSYKK